MNDDSSRREREVTELARLLPTPAGRDLPAGRQQILKEHLMSEIRRTEASSRPAASGQHRKRNRGLAAAAAGVTAIALGTAGVVGAHILSAPARPAVSSSGHSIAGTPTAAAVLLAKIAKVAARQQNPAVRDSQFVYIRSKVAYEVDTIVKGHDTSKLEKLHKREVWLPVANVCVTGLLIENGSRTLLSPFPVVNGKVDRSPGKNGQPDLKCPSKGHLGDVSYRLLQSLPTRPGPLLRYLKAGRKWTNDDPIVEIGDLIREASIPPAVAAALYRVAALLPGATLVRHATNAVGKRGIAIAWKSGTGAQHRFLTEWIFDRKTLQYIGERDLDVTAGTVTGESAILQRAFVDKAGQRP